MEQQYVLIVDDDRDIRETLQDILEDEGFNVAVASNGRDAMDRFLVSSTPALVLMDMRMPVMNGGELLEQMAKVPHLATVPVIICSATLRWETAPTDAECLPKPLDIPSLVARVRFHVAKGKANDADDSLTG